MQSPYSSALPPAESRIRRTPLPTLVYRGTSRWEKVLVPTQRLYRPLLARLYFKLGVLHEMQGLVERSVLCYQEVGATSDACIFVCT